MQTLNLFQAKTKVKETKAGKTHAVHKAQLSDKIHRFAELKKQIDSLTGELKMIEGDIKTAGKDIFLTQYEAQKSTPDNFKIEDETGGQCLFICMDKYTVVDEGKAEILRGYDNLLDENVLYKFNTELVEKYGAVLSELICNSPDIDDNDKGNLIAGEKTYTVKKGSIDRLMQYPNCREIFELINPICSLKK